MNELDAKIVKLWRDGLTQRQIAKQAGVSTTMAAVIVRRCVSESERMERKRMHDCQARILTDDPAEIERRKQEVDRERLARLDEWESKSDQRHRYYVARISGASGL